MIINNFTLKKKKKTSIANPFTDIATDVFM